MQFIYEADVVQAATALAERLNLELQAGRKVAWFISGGSNIPLCVNSMASLADEITSNVTILLLDERFGVPGHPDSNWQQLQEAGFDPKQARAIPTLQAEKTLEAVCTDYEAIVHNVIETSDIVIAQCGIGGDGHVAGILPHSTAVTDSEWVTGYDGGTYKRITVTPPVWEHIDVAYAFAYGDTKQGTLSRLKNDALSIEAQPAQLLKLVPESYIYTDQRI